MQKLTKEGVLEPADLSVQGKDESLDTSVSTNRILIHATTFLTREREAESNVGIWLDSDDDVDAIKGKTDNVAIIGINFPAFADGRGFSLAQQLRADLKFSGEIIAIGHYMEEQLYYLKRCGFDSFLLNENSDIEAMQLILRDFSNHYQASSTETKPLFKRRLFH